MHECRNSVIAWCKGSQSDVSAPSTESGRHRAIGQTPRVVERVVEEHATMSAQEKQAFALPGDALWDVHGITDAVLQLKILFG